MNRNPYKYNGALDPLSDELVCAPRSAEIKRVINGLLRGDYWAILGPDQIGKTTFLRQVKNGFPNAHYIYYDLSVSQKSEKDFYRSLMQSFLTEIPSEPIEISDESWQDAEPVFSFLEFLKKFKPNNDLGKIVLLFDEIDSLPSLKTFLQAWRKVYHDRYHKKELKRYSIILTGSASLISLTIGPNSPFNIADTLYLNDISLEESEELIQKPLEHLNINIEEKAKQKLLSQISGHPQLLQHACHLLVGKAVASNMSIAEKDVEDALRILFKTNTILETLIGTIKDEDKLEKLLESILKGEKKTYHPYKAFSMAGAGAVVEDGKGFCKIRNNLYERFLLDHFGLGGLITKESETCYLNENVKNPLPFALKQLKVKNYYGINNAELSKLPADAQWIFITGFNAFGKSAVLQALVIGLFGPKDENTILTGDQVNCEIGVEVYSNGGNLINNVENDSKVPGFNQCKNFAAYGPSRLEIQSPETQNIIKIKSSQTYSLFNTDGIQLNVELELLLNKTDSKFDIVRQALLHVLHNIADIELRKRKEGKEEKDAVYYSEEESGEEQEKYEPIPFRKLAAGHKSIVAMVGDILIRLYRHQPNVTDTKDLQGIVIIDELDVHLHPKWLRELPKLLSDVFPSVQFIVSTHSVIPFLGAPEKSVFLKVNRNKKEGITIDRLNIDVKELLPNTILTSPIFDMDEIANIHLKNLDNVRTEDRYKKIVDVDDMRKTLKALEESEEDFPEDLFEKG